MPAPSNVRLIDRREFALRFLQLAAALAVPARVFAETTRGEFAVIVQRDVMVAMRDGVKLATDIYLPAKNGKRLEQPVPVILERTPYGKSGKTRAHATDPNARSDRGIKECLAEIGARNVELSQKRLTCTRDDFLVRPLFLILARIHAAVSQPIPISQKSALPVDDKVQPSDS